MKLEDQNCSLSQAKKLKELGIDQNALWYWYYPINDKMISTKKGIIHTSITSDYLEDNEGDEFDHAVAAAFTASEICDMLPDLIEYNNFQYELVIVKEAPDTWLFQYSRNNDLMDTLQHIDRVYKKTMAQAAAYMLIHLLEIEKITAEEINKRLTE